jgi:hypothetical protein
LFHELGGGRKGCGAKIERTGSEIWCRDPDIVSKSRHLRGWTAHCNCREDKTLDVSGC